MKLFQVKSSKQVNTATKDRGKMLFEHMHTHSSLCTGEPTESWEKVKDICLAREKRLEFWEFIFVQVPSEKKNRRFYFCF